MDLKNYIKYKFASVIVLYNPENDMYIKSLKILNKLNIKLYVFDNSDKVHVRKKNKLNIEMNFDKVTFYSENNGNVGISKAYNIVVSNILKKDDLNGLFLFDQDSQIEKKSLQRLIKNFKFLSDKEQFGSISGFPIRNSNEPYGLYKFGTQNYERTGIISVSRVPSSYSLIPITTFKRIGLFNENYFIDHIDIDFCLRCSINKLGVYVDKYAPFIHNVGEGDLNLFGLIKIPVCSPYRHYYQVRNQILCYKQYKTSLLKLILNLTRRFVLIFIISLFKFNFVHRIKFSILGVLDGLNNVKGKLKTY